jgi:hypothetical protein
MRGPEVLCAFALTFGLALGSSLAAQDVTAGDSGDVFSQEETVVAPAENAQAAAPTQEVLKGEGVRLTGLFSATSTVSATWDTVGTTSFDFLEPRDRGLTPGLTLNLGFSAKPDTDLAFYGEIRTAYPFVNSATVFVPNPAAPNDPTRAVPTTLSTPDVQVFTLSTRFNWNDQLFFVFGKQPVRWGTGYFFTPADDILSLTQVDLQNPTAQREGPLALKVQYPIPRTLSNIYLFVVAPRDATKLVDLALAPKVEIQFGNTELGLAGYYQKDAKPQLVAMGSTGVSGLNIFGEARVGFGSTRVYVVKRAVDYTSVLAPGYVSSYSTELRPDTPVFTGTLGASYLVSDWKMSVFAQYLYNGDGYADLTLGDLLNAMAQRLNPFYPDAADPVPGLSDAGIGSSVGQHYAAASISWTELFGTKFGFSVFALANLSDFSGYVKPTLSLEVFPRMTLSASTTVTFGDNGDEFTDPAGIPRLIPGSSTYDPSYTARPTLSLALGLDLGSGGF